MKFYAHSSERSDKDDWQLLSEHLLSVGQISAGFADAFGASALADVAGKLHDLGKYTEAFQKRLEGDPKRVDHATRGAKVAIERYGQFGVLLAYVIAGHHAGLANGRDGDASVRSSLKNRLETVLPELLSVWEQEVPLPVKESVALPAGYKPCRDRGMFQLALLVRMIFSCLVDADFIDTDEFYRRIEGKRPRRSDTLPTLKQLRARLDERLSSFEQDTEVNRLRAEILSHVRSESLSKPGLFSLTVPTGGGKTLASLAFALDHAIAHGLQRVIYVIPFTSIVEQNAQVFRDAFGDLGEAAVLEHHSAFFDDPGKALESREKRKLAMENWDAPVVVTTAVQFFESFFADRPSRCRKLHNVAGSVVILDEAQTLPLKLLRPCVTLIDELALNYRSSIVLCTATQPALREDQGFRHGLQNVRELAPNPPMLYERLRRVNVRHIGVLGDEALAEQLRQREQVLCIVNNRRHARALYESIADQPGARHLTTLMYANHRRAVLAQVKKDLQEGKPCRLVSTSLIEAGVDIDFPTVLRAEAGLDSIAQAAGRCNREGKRPLAGSETLVFATENPDWAPPIELAQFAQVFRSVHRRHLDELLSLDAVHDYFQELYWQRGDAELDAEDLLGLLRRCGPDSLPMETLARRFRFIETVMQPVIVPFHPGCKVMTPEVEDALSRLEYAPSLARMLQPYLVQIPKRGYEAMRKSGAIQPVAQERYGDQFMQLTNPDLYSEKFGLHWDDPVFIKAESLVN